MTKRGSTNYSCVLALDKPVGMSSHDVVNIVRRTLGEGRVGHAGTLDPLASGVLFVCVGPATRLNTYLGLRDKTYEVAIELGSATATDDAEGEVIAQAPIKQEYFDQDFARAKITSLIGKHQQIPPAYSAIKVKGQKAYTAARKGRVIELSSRAIEIYAAELLSVEHRRDFRGLNVPVWRVRLHVSKGTYIRSIARDLGNSLGSFAHVAALRRCAVGSFEVRRCCSVKDFENNPKSAQVDPLELLGIRYSFVQGDDALFALDNGQPFLADEIALNEPIKTDVFDTECCTTSVVPSAIPPAPSELVALLNRNDIKGLYRFDTRHHVFKPDCIFSLGVTRGAGI